MTLEDQYERADRARDNAKDEQIQRDARLRKAAAGPTTDPASRLLGVLRRASSAVAEFGLDPGAVGEDLMALDDALTPILYPDGEIEADARVTVLCLQLFALHRWSEEASRTWSCATANEVAAETLVYDTAAKRLTVELDAACAGHPGLEAVREALRAEIRRSVA